MNIVKFHGYWQDRTKIDDRPRVSCWCLQNEIPFIYFHLSIGCFHHRIHVKWFSENFITENEKNQTKSFEEFLETMVYSTTISLKV